VVILWWWQQLGPRVNIIEVAIDKKKRLCFNTPFYQWPYVLRLICIYSFARILKYAFYSFAGRESTTKLGHTRLLFLALSIAIGSRLFYRKVITPWVKWVQGRDDLTDLKYLYLYSMSWCHDKKGGKDDGERSCNG